MAAQRLLLAAVMVLAVLAQASAGDPSPVQDFCVSNGRGGCQDQRSATANDFFFQGLRAGSTQNEMGFSMTLLDADAVPGLNTLGVSVARLAFGSGGLNPPHYYSRATEVTHVLQGSLQVGFVSSDNKLYTKTLRTGDVFVFPAGLIHYQLASESGVIAISAFSSQNPGRVVVRDALFGSSPSIPNEILNKAFGIDQRTISKIKA